MNKLKFRIKEQKMYRKNILLVLCLCAGIFLANAQEKIKVGCIGNSITGFHQYNYYATPLQQMLGDEYLVDNFGKGGSGIFREMRENGADDAFAYLNSTECEAALEFNADIVIVKFGANDCNRQNFTTYGVDVFKSDYKDLLKKFTDKNPDVRIILCSTPALFYGPEGLWGTGSYDDTTNEEILQPAIKELAEELGYTLVDLYTPLKPHPEYFGDKVHPDHRGHFIIAKEVYKGITGKEFQYFPGGVTFDANNDDYMGTMGESIEFDMAFGSVNDFSIVEVETTGKTEGALKFYLDGTAEPFATLSLTENSTGFDKAIKGDHKIKIVWDGASATLNSVKFREEKAPFSPDPAKEYYLVNKSRGYVIEVKERRDGSNNLEGSPCSLQPVEEGNEKQLFTLESFSYDSYLIRSVSSEKHVRCNTTVTIDNPGGSDYNPFGGAAKEFTFLVKNYDGAYYTIGNSDEALLGMRNAVLKNSLTGNKKMSELSDVDLWEIVEKEKMPTSITEVQPDSDSVKAFASNGTVFVQGLHETDCVKIYNMEGKVINQAIATGSEVSFGLPIGIYIVSVDGIKKNIKVLVK